MSKHRFLGLCVAEKEDGEAKGIFGPIQLPYQEEGDQGSKQGEGEGNAREVDPQRLDKLPKEIWEKILNDLNENDLFPLALSCRYFRQKQVELVARTGQNGPESGRSQLALKTTFQRKREKVQLASADYFRFCSKEKVKLKALTDCVSNLTAYHGHLPLLKELNPPKRLHRKIAAAAGESSSSVSSSYSLFWLLTCSSSLQRTEAS